jgi:hypothetical protein
LPLCSGIKLSPDAEQELNNNSASNQAWKQKVERLEQARAGFVQVSGALSIAYHCTSPLSCGLTAIYDPFLAAKSSLLDNIVFTWTVWHARQLQR